MHAYVRDCRARCIHVAKLHLSTKQRLTASNSVCHSLTRLRQLPWVKVGRDSSVGIATCYGLDGPGIESVPIPVAELSKADRLLGLRVQIPPGARMFVLCVAQ